MKNKNTDIFDRCYFYTLHIEVHNKDIQEMEKHLNTPGEIMNMLDSIVAVDPIKDVSIDYNHN